ncbi:MAG: Crp/Fnr family transcriptional regulator [Bacteroidales bacterium]|nr:Crp/Fnr family transcriptional regulator [Bacteroidales bacterium]
MGNTDKEVHCLDCTFKSKCFNLLSKNELKELSQSKVSINYKKGEIIRKQGTFVSSVLFVKKGIAKIYKEFEHAENVSIVDFRKPGQLIGLPDIFNDNLIQYTVAALTDCEVCSIDIRLFEDLLNNNGSFAVGIIKSNNNQTNDIIDFHIQNNYKQLHGRIAHALVVLSDKVFESNSFNVPFTRRDFAEFTNMSSMSVVRILKVFRNDKLIEMKDGLIKILDKEKLEKISQFG